MAIVHPSISAKIPVFMPVTRLCKNVKAKEPRPDLIIVRKHGLKICINGTDRKSLAVTAVRDIGSKRLFTDISIFISSWPRLTNLLHIHISSTQRNVYCPILRKFHRRRHFSASIMCRDSAPEAEVNIRKEFQKQQTAPKRGHTTAKTLPKFRGNRPSGCGDIVT